MRCKARTREGDQCRNNAIPGTEYCYIKSHGCQKILFHKRALNFVRNHWIGIFSVIVTLVLAYIPLRYYFQDKRQTSLHGSLYSKKTANRKYIAVGCTLFIIDSPDDVFIRDGNDPVLSLKMINNKLYVSAIIRDNNGNLVAELKGNEWKLNRNSFFDRNYNDHVLEVRDRTGKVVLQVANLGEVIHFAGIFHCKNGWTYGLLPIGQAGAIMEIRPPGVELEYEIEPICNYPSETHLGESPGLRRLRQMIRVDGRGYRLCGSLEIGNR